MTPTEYASKLRHAADVIEFNGAEVLYQICFDHYGITLPSFQRIFAGKVVERKQQHGSVELEANLNGIRFYTHLEMAAPKESTEVTLPAVEAA